MTRTLALTGATGFVGGHVLREAQLRGWRVRALVRSKEIDGVETARGDLHDAVALAKFVSGSDCVVHVAGAIAARDRLGFFAANAEGTANLAAAAEKAGARRFIHVSSLAARHPELSDYAASKRAGEMAVERLASAAILRPPAVYGPGDRGILPLVQQLTRRTAFLPGHINQRFSLLYAPDLARLALDAADGSWTGIRDADDGMRGGYSWRDLIAAASQAEGKLIHPVFLPRHALALLSRISAGGSRLIGRAAMLTPGKVNELYHDDWVARDALTVEDPTPFAEGFRQTVAWYRQHGWLPERRPADRRQATDNEKNPA
jgi:nucleoside-diphosphate-sugar epimerase